MHNTANAKIAHQVDTSAATSSLDKRDELDFISACTNARMATLKGGALHLRQSAGSLSFLARNHYATVFLSPLEGAESAVGGSKRHTYDAPLGMIGIVPAGADASTVWAASRESVSIAITQASLFELALHEFDVGSVELRPLDSVVVDQAALYIARLLKAELKGVSGQNELYVDSLLTQFGVHLLRNYSGISKVQPVARGGLSLDRARLVRDYLAENLSDKLSVAELAALCGLSPSYFIKAFTSSFGQRPYQYLTNLRLDRAHWLIGQGEMTIAEIALCCGFSSQSHLTSTFRKYRGLTPAQLRQR